MSPHISRSSKKSQPPSKCWLQWKGKSCLLEKKWTIRRQVFQLKLLSIIPEKHFKNPRNIFFNKYKHALYKLWLTPFLPSKHTSILPNHQKTCPWYVVVYSIRRSLGRFSRMGNLSLTEFMEPVICVLIRFGFFQGSNSMFSWTVELSYQQKRDADSNLLVI